MMLNKVKYIAQLPWEQSTFLSAANKRISVEPQTTAHNGSQWFQTVSETYGRELMQDTLEGDHKCLKQQPFSVEKVPRVIHR